MLVLQGKKGESFFICDKDDNEIAELVVISVKGKNVRLGFQANKDEINFYRGKVLKRKRAERTKPGN